MRSSKKVDKAKAWISTHTAARRSAAIEADDALALAAHPAEVTRAVATVQNPVPVAVRRWGH